MKKHLFSFFVSACVAFFAAQAVSALQTQNVVIPGAWNNKFNESKSYSEAMGMPLLVFWANPGCSQCKKLEEACDSDAFLAWQKKKNILMVFVNGTDTEEEKAAKNFAKTGKDYPFVAVYWPKADTTVYQRFCGRSGKMPNSNANDALEKQFMDAIDSLTEGWNSFEEAYVGGDFLVPNVKSSRLEAIVGETKSVIVPLVRTNAFDCVATNLLVAGDQSYDVIWRKGETSYNVEIETSHISKGESIELKLFYTNALRAVSSIHGVERVANSSANPRSFGEKFEFGEWTLDYEAAREKVISTDGAHLLTLFSGTLWCPYCIGIENTLLSDARFKSWARDNKVALVVFDQGRGSTPATALGQMGPRLVTYVGDPKKFGDNAVSGASYRSRNAISEEQANTYINQVALYTHKWLAPDATAARLGNPTLLLVNAKEETVAARFGGYRDGMVYDVEENITRLEQLLKLAGKRDLNNYPSTTELTYTVCSTTQVSLCASDVSRCFKIDTEPGRISFSTVPEINKDVRLTILCGTNILETGNGSVSCIVSPGYAETGIALKVEGVFSKGNNSAEIEFSSSWNPVSFDNKYYGTNLEVVLPIVKDSYAVGMLTVTASKKNAVKAKYICDKTTRSITFSGRWESPDELGNIVMRDVKHDKELQLVLSPSGIIEAELSDSDYGECSLTGRSDASPINFSDYTGIYTVALPVSEGAFENNYASIGVGTIVIDATSSSAKKKGKVKCSVTYPDGKTSSFTGLLTSSTGGFADLLIFSRSSKNRFSVPLSIRYRSADAPSARAVIVQPNMLSFWKHDEKDFTFIRECRVYGSRYDKDKSLIEASGTESLVANFDFESLFPSERYGIISKVIGDDVSIEVSERKLKEGEKNFSLSYNRSKGMVSGSSKIIFEDGTSRTCKYRGVVLPDWYDCGCYEADEFIPLEVQLPFVIGTATFTDKKGSRTVTRGLSFGFYLP